MRPINEKHYELDSKIGHKQDRRENFLMNPTRQRLIEEVVVEAGKRPEKMLGKGGKTSGHSEK
jgi:hypothetical protein